MESKIVVVEEILRREIEFPNARSQRKALDIVTDDYCRENIVLDSLDLAETNIYVKNWENLKVLFQEGDKTLLNRGTTYEPYVVVTDYDPATQSWWYGHYFESFYDAVNYMKYGGDGKFGIRLTEKEIRLLVDEIAENRGLEDEGLSNPNDFQYDPVLWYILSELDGALKRRGRKGVL